MRLTLQLAAVLFTSFLSPAHEGNRHSIDISWNWDVLVLVPLIATIVVYGIGLWRSRGAAAPRWHIASFFAGWLVLAIAQLSPIHKIGSALFSVHMGQHELLMLIAAPLLAIGRPLVIFIWALPQAGREAVGGFLKRPRVVRIWSLISLPLSVWILHGAMLWVWHIPVLFEAALRDQAIHVLQHAMFLATAALFWWTLIHGRYGRLAYGLSVLYVFTTAVHSGALGALITIADRVWYPNYSRGAAGLSGLEDQQLAGLIMWIPAGVVFLVIGLALFAAWLGESERRSMYSQLAVDGQPEK
jgi:putative membrane protein